MELTESEQADLRAILLSIFGQEARFWKINSGTLGATAKMIAGAKNCSKAINFVPRPGLIDKDYFRRQLRDMARRAANHDQIYEICRANRVHWKSTIYAASEGMGY